MNVVTTSKIELEIIKPFVNQIGTVKHLEAHQNLWIRSCLASLSCQLVFEEEGANVPLLWCQNEFYIIVMSLLRFISFVSQAALLFVPLLFSFWCTWVLLILSFDWPLCVCCLLLKRIMKACLPIVCMVQLAVCVKKRSSLWHNTVKVTVWFL